jgi:ribosome-associated toxin RatA of RatAB toxin-antitoxin module
VRTTIAIDVNAPSRTVFDLASDVSAWAGRLAHYRYVTVLSHKNGSELLAMSAVRPVGPFGIPVAWRSRYWSEDADAGDLRLRFVHVAGVTRGMDVTWHIREKSAGSCSVTIEHDFRRRVPLLGPDALPRLVDRFFVRPIAGRTLASFKVLAEGG